MPVVATGGLARTRLASPYSLGRPCAWPGQRAPGPCACWARRTWLAPADTRAPRVATVGGTCIARHRIATRYLGYIKVHTREITCIRRVSALTRERPALYHRTLPT